MDDQLKDKVLIASIVLAAVCLVLAISSGISASKNKTGLQKEMTQRIETEEKLNGVSSRITSLESDLKKAQDELAQTKTALNQEQLASQALKSELEKLTRLKEQLEKDLKEALSSNTAK
jgi:chromosome segregation ATPase